MLLCGCAPTFAGPDTGTLMPAVEDGAIIARDGTHLPLRRWEAQGADKPRAVIVALHGMSDYSNAFAMPARIWARRGITTLAYDQRGFGRSAHPGIWAGSETMRADLDDAVLAARARYPGVPVFALGESMGGAVVLTALASAVPPKVDGAILAAPAVWSRGDMPISYRVALFLGAHLLPGMILSNNAAGRVAKIVPSDNIPMLIALGKDPLFQKQTRTDTLYGLVNLMDEARRAPAAIRTAPPILFLHGANDQVIPAEPTRAVIAALDGKATVKRYAHGYHMLFRDLDGETVAKDVADWIAGVAETRETLAPAARYHLEPFQESEMATRNNPNDLRNGKPGEDAETNASLASHEARVMPTTKDGENVVNPGVGSSAGMAEGQVTKSN